MIIKSVTGQILILRGGLYFSGATLVEKNKNYRGSPIRTGSRRFRNLEKSRLLVEKANLSASKSVNLRKELKSDSKNLVDALKRKKFRNQLNLKANTFPTITNFGSSDSRYIRSNKKVLSTKFRKTREKEDQRLTALIYKIILWASLFD